MEKENKGLDIDHIIRDSLKEHSGPGFSDSFSDRLIRKIEERLVRREIISEFFWKILLVILLLVFAAGIFFIPQFRGFLSVLTGFSSKWLIFTYAGIIVLFTLFVDQVILKYLFFRKKH